MWAFRQKYRYVTTRHFGIIMDWWHLTKITVSVIATICLRCTISSHLCRQCHGNDILTYVDTPLITFIVDHWTWLKHIVYINMKRTRQRTRQYKTSTSHSNSCNNSVIQCVNSANFSFRKCVNVVFSGEDAEDRGGPTREFLHELLVTLCITHVISCMWCVNTSIYVYDWAHQERSSCSYCCALAEWVSEWAVS